MDRYDLNRYNLDEKVMYRTKSIQSSRLKKVCKQDVNEMFTRRTESSYLDLKTSAPKIDESEINYDVNEVTLQDIKGQNQESITINISYDKQEVGYMIFTVYENEQRLYIENIEVWDIYRGLGLAQYLYKKFGEIYKDRFNGWIVEREFQNPAAEAAFKKAIDQGWVPVDAFNEDYTRRNYA